MSCQCTVSCAQMTFSGKVVLITGASSGIGAATALKFASLDACLALVGRNVDNLKKVSSQCTTPKNVPLLITAELTDEKETEEVINKTTSHFGRLDVLVNSAGILEIGGIEETTMQQYDRIMNTNFRSLYHLTSLAVPHLIQSKGNIVNVASINGLRAFSGVLAYCVSKAAVVHFTKCIALDLAPKQVRVNSVSPGVISTNLHQRSGQTKEQYEAFLERSAQTHALGRIGKAEEVATSIVFLASDEASFITGISLSVDGGKHAMTPR